MRGLLPANQEDPANPTARSCTPRAIASVQIVVPTVEAVLFRRSNRDRAPAMSTAGCSALRALIQSADGCQPAGRTEQCWCQIRHGKRVRVLHGHDHSGLVAFRFVGVATRFKRATIRLT